MDFLRKTLDVDYCLSETIHICGDLWILACCFNYKNNLNNAQPIITRCKLDQDDRHPTDDN